MYVVYNNCKSLNNNLISWEAAIKYAKEWLGKSDTLPSDLEDREMKVFVWDYSGCGDTIEIYKKCN